MWQNSPEALPPSWPTRSISKKPGSCSFQSAKVRIGIWCFRRLPGLVWVRPLICTRARSGLSSRSMVAAADAQQLGAHLGAERDLAERVEHRQHGAQHDHQALAAHEVEHVPDLREGLQHLLVVAARSRAGLGAPGATDHELDYLSVDAHQAGAPHEFSRWIGVLACVAGGLDELAEMTVLSFLGGAAVRRATCSVSALRSPIVSPISSEPPPRCAKGSGLDREVQPLR